MQRSAILLLCGLVTAACEGDKKASNERTPVASDASVHTPRPGDQPPPNRFSVEDIAEASGTETTVMPDGVVRIGWSRDDVPVTIDGSAFPPAAGLGSWAAFAPVAREAMVMGDTVVFQDEINPAIDAAFANGLHITALHNHFVFDDPPVYFMHIGGRGDSRELAAGVKAMWDAIKAVRKASPTPANAFPGGAVASGTLDAAALGAIVGHPAETKPGGVVKVVVARTAEMGGLSFGGTMGLTTWAAFRGDATLASIDGDVAMTAGEVQRVLRALRAAKINVVALHNHMVGETPAYFFVHFWGKGPAADLARGFRAVLDAQSAD